MTLTTDNERLIQFRALELWPELARRCDATRAPALTARRDLARYYELLAAELATLRLRPSVAAALLQQLAGESRPAVAAAKIERLLGVAPTAAQVAALIDVAEQATNGFALALPEGERLRALGLGGS